MKGNKKSLLLLAALYLGGLLFFAFTSPDSLPLPILILPFIYVFVTLFLTIKTVMRLLPRGINSATSVALTVSILLVLIMVLASLHQLTVKDILISLALAVLLSWYITKIKSTD